MNIDINIYVLFGGILGFIFFLYKLESPGMGNVLFRINSSGNKEFSFDSLVNIIIAPFKYSHFWTNVDLYSINWIITTFVGGFSFYILSF
jgi:hypothetical protein